MEGLKFSRWLNLPNLLNESMSDASILIPVQYVSRLHTGCMSYASCLQVGYILYACLSQFCAYLDLELAGGISRSVTQVGQFGPHIAHPSLLDIFNSLLKRSYQVCSYIKVTYLKLRRTILFRITRETVPCKQDMKYPRQLHVSTATNFRTDFMQVRDFSAPSWRKNLSSQVEGTTNFRLTVRKNLNSQVEGTTNRCLPAESESCRKDALE